MTYVLASAMDRAGIADYVALFREAFPGDGKLTEQYLEWQYLQNPHGRVIGADAFDDQGRLAAHYAIMPRLYTLGGVEYRAALSINTATHPAHQGKGLFTRLAQATYEQAAGAGVQFVIGAANANSVGGFTRKLGFSNLGQIRLYPGLAAPPARPDDLHLAISDSWLNWRLRNPSRLYRARSLGAGGFAISTVVKRVPFHLGRAPLSDGLSALNRQYLPMPGLAPVFSASPPRGPKLPHKLQPSPWHLIWKDLGPNPDPQLPAALRMDGLSMDTF